MVGSSDPVNVTVPSSETKVGLYTKLANLIAPSMRISMRTGGVAGTSGADSGAAAAGFGAALAGAFLGRAGVPLPAVLVAMAAIVSPMRVI